MSFWSGLGKVLGIAAPIVAAPFTGGASLGALVPKIIGAGGVALGSLAKTQAANRGTQLGADMDMDRLRLARAADDRASGTDAWKKLQQASYTQNRTPYQAPMVNGHQLSTFGFGHGGSTPEELQGAQGMQKEVLARLTGGSQLPPLTDTHQAGQMSGWEKLLNILAPTMTIAGQFGQANQRPISQNANDMSGGNYA